MDEMKKVIPYLGGDMFFPLLKKTARYHHKDRARRMNEIEMLNVEAQEQLPE